MGLLRAAGLAIIFIIDLRRRRAWRLGLRQLLPRLLSLRPADWREEFFVHMIMERRIEYERQRVQPRVENSASSDSEDDLMQWQ